MAESYVLHNQEMSHDRTRHRSVRKAAEEKSRAAGYGPLPGRMTSLQMARRTVIFTVDAAGIASLMDRAREDIPGLTTMRDLPGGDEPQPRYFLGDRQERQFRHREPKGEGFLAVLPLTHEGMRRLIDGSLDTRNPELCYVDTAIGTAGGNLRLGDPCQGHDGRGDSAGAAEDLDAALSRRQHLFAADHQGRTSGFWSRSGFKPGARYEELFTPRTADVRPFARDCPRPGCGA